MAEPMSHPFGARARVRHAASRYTGFEPDARRFLASALLVGAAISLFWIDFNLYLAALGFNAPTIGLIATGGSLAGVVVAFPASALSDRVGRRAILIAGLALDTVSLIGFIVVTNVVAIAALVFAWNLGLGAFFVVTNPFLLEHSQPDHRNELFSLVFAIENITNVVAAVVGGIAAQAIAGIAGLDPNGPGPFRILLVAMAVVTGLGTLTLFRISDDRAALAGIRARHEEERRQRGLDREGGRPSGRLPRLPRLPRLRIVGDRKTFLRLLVPGFVIACGAGQVIPFLNLFIERKFGLEIAALNAVFAITSLGTIAAILVQPAIARRVGKVASVVLVQGVSIPFLLVLGFSPILWTVVLAMAIRSSLMNAGNPIANAFAMEVAHPADRATLSAAQSLLWSLGWVIAGPFYSLTQAALGFDLGYTVNFVTIVVLYAVAIAVYWAWFRDLEPAIATADVTGYAGPS